MEAPSAARPPAGSSFAACALLLASILGCGDEDPTPPPDPTGACCLEKGCAILPAEECFDRGVFLGSDTTCDPPACLPLGACCGDRVCDLTLEQDCVHPLVYQGDDTACIPNPCPETGACCFGFDCESMTEPDCALRGGDYWGDASVCDPLPGDGTGPNRGGVLLLHYAAALSQTQVGRTCRVEVTACADVVAQAPADASVLAVVLAAFPLSTEPRVSALRFGIQHDLEIADWSPCAPFAETTDGWPGPFSGIRLDWSPEPATDRLFPVAWFLAYATEEGTLALGNHPTAGLAGFSSDGPPATFDRARALGTLGFGPREGTRLCPCP